MATSSYLKHPLLLLLLSPFVVTNARDYIDSDEGKETHLHFYFHDIVTGPKPNAVFAARPTTTIPDSNFFGSVVVGDNTLTEGPDLSSKLVGRAQGTYTFAAQDKIAMVMNINFVLVEGKYNGSTLTMVGRNEAFTKVRETPIVGGTGYFRGDTSYVVAQTYGFNQTSGDVVVEYNIYVVQR